MKRMLRRICAWMLALCLPLSGAMAETEWFSREFSSFLDVNNDTRFSLSIQLNELQPFSPDTAAMLNDVLSHIQIESRIQSDQTVMALGMDGEKLLTFEEVQKNGRYAMTTSLLPNRVLAAGSSPMDLLSGNEMVQEEPFSLHRAVEELEACYQELTDAIVPYATEKVANYKISGIGHAKWVRLAKMTAEDASSLLPQVVKVLGCGMDQAFRDTLTPVGLGNNFTIALYYDEENGDPLALYMKGQVLMTEDDKWSLAYQWAFTRGEEPEDSFTCTLSQNGAPRYKREIEASRLNSGSSEEQKLTHQMKMVIRDAEGHRTLQDKDSLTAALKDGKTVLEGSLVHTHKLHEGDATTTTVTTITPELTLTSESGSGVLSGQVTLTETKSQKVIREMVFLFDQQPALELEAAAEDGSLFAVVGEEEASVAGSSLAQNTDVIWDDPDQKDYLVGTPPLGLTAYAVPDGLKTIDLDTVDEETKATLLDEMAQNGAGVLLIALGKLPGETLALLSDNMSEEDYAAFLAMLGEL